MASSRLPGKPMRPMLGMPMVGHCFFRAKLAKGIESVYVATCDSEIAEYVLSIGGQAILTSSTHQRAATRTAEALEAIQKTDGSIIDDVVMMQGDEPLIQPRSISQVAATLTGSRGSMVNLVSVINDNDIFHDRNNVKAVVDKANKVLYLSREAIPSDWVELSTKKRLLQTGIIGFSQGTLRDFNAMKEAYLEQIESIDMNRVLENCGHVQAVIADYFTLGVDTLEEFDRAEKLLANDPTTKQYLNNP